MNTPTLVPIPSNPDLVSPLSTTTVDTPTVTSDNTESSDRSRTRETPSQKALEEHIIQTPPTRTNTFTRKGKGTVVLNDKKYKSKYIHSPSKLESLSSPKSKQLSTNTSSTPLRPSISKSSNLNPWKNLQTTSLKSSNTTNTTTVTTSLFTTSSLPEHNFDDTIQPVPSSHSTTTSSSSSSYTKSLKDIMHEEQQCQLEEQHEQHEQHEKRESSNNRDNACTTQIKPPEDKQQVLDQDENSNDHTDTTTTTTRNCSERNHLNQNQRYNHHHHHHPPKQRLMYNRNNDVNEYNSKKKLYRYSPGNKQYHNNSSYNNHYQNQTHYTSNYYNKKKFNKNHYSNNYYKQYNNNHHRYKNRNNSRHRHYKQNHRDYESTLKSPHGSRRSDSLHKTEYLIPSLSYMSLNENDHSSSNFTTTNTFTHDHPNHNHQSYDHNMNMNYTMMTCEEYYAATSSTFNEHHYNNNPNNYNHIPKSQRKRIISLDCEMVGIGESGETSALARVCIINYDYEILLETYVKVDEPVTDYRTFVSGIQPQNIHSNSSALDFTTCRNLVLRILRNKILVGHGLENDLAALKIVHPKCMIRDTATYPPYMSATLVSPMMERGRRSSSSSSCTATSAISASTSSAASTLSTSPSVVESDCSSTASTSSSFSIGMDAQFHHLNGVSTCQSNGVGSSSSGVNTSVSTGINTGISTGISTGSGPLMQLKPRKLKEIAREWLGISIQKCGEEHSPFDDACAALGLYQIERGRWESYIM